MVRCSISSCITHKAAAVSVLHQSVAAGAQSCKAGGEWGKLAPGVTFPGYSYTGNMNKTFGGKEIMFWIFAQCSAPINRTKNCPELSSFILTPGQKNCIFLEGEAPGQLCLPELH